MTNVIGVRFPGAGKLYYFDPGVKWPTPGDYVVVETARGVELGVVVMPVHELDETRLSSPLRKVIRIADADDLRHDAENREAEKSALAICQRKVEEHKLDMKLVNAEITFDNNKILFNFTANGRVDFRALVKDLASVFHTRIELHQIGARDEAKLLGGLGPCGRPICCASFMGDFQPVTIRMAKEQGLSLNPTKISGICGRLMCCLKYEEDDYELIRKRMPRMGREVSTPDGTGTVCDINILRETVKVRVQKGDSGEIKEYPLTDVQWNRGSGAPRAEEPPEEDEVAASAPEAEEPAPDAAVQPEQKPQRREAPEEGKGQRRSVWREKKPSKPRTDSQPPMQEPPAPVRRVNPAAQAEQARPAPQPEQPRPASGSWKQALAQAKEKAHMENG